jgi:hypothetical protein
MFAGVTCSRNLVRLSRNGALALLVLAFVAVSVAAQKKRIPPGGRIAVVVDARLAALRSNPGLNASLVRRMGRGSFVSIRGSQRTGDGILFHRVAVSSRTSGWIQSDAVVAGWRANDDERLLRLIAGPDEFERLARSRIFLDTFPHSALRPTVLLRYSQAAEEAAAQLSRQAQRQFERNEATENSAPLFSYFLNYNGLDRYNRQGARFAFDESTKSFHYDGAALREILRRYPQSKEAPEARAMLEKLEAFKVRK